MSQVMTAAGVDALIFYLHAFQNDTGNPDLNLAVQHCHNYMILMEIATLLSILSLPY